MFSPCCHVCTRVSMLSVYTRVHSSHRLSSFLCVTTDSLNLEHWLTLYRNLDIRGRHPRESSKKHSPVALNWKQVGPAETLHVMFIITLTRLGVHFSGPWLRSPGLPRLLMVRPRFRSPFRAVRAVFADNVVTFSGHLRCAGCGADFPPGTNYLTALDQAWHPCENTVYVWSLYVRRTSFTTCSLPCMIVYLQYAACFVCAHCNKVLGNDSSAVYSVNGQP